MFSKNLKNCFSFGNHRHLWFYRSYCTKRNYPPIQLMSLNCYLVPKLFTFRKQNDTCRWQDDRAKKIASFAKDHPIVCLQEMWGAHAFELQKELQATHEFISGYKSLELFGTHSKTLDTILSWIRKNGGTWFAHHQQFQRLGHWKKVFKVSESWSMKGVQVLFLDLDSIWSKKKLLIFNTHLDPILAQNRKHQIEEIFEFMEKVTQECQKNHSLEEIGVLLLGDFNIPSKWEEYLQLRERYPQLRDLYLESKKKKPKNQKETNLKEEEEEEEEVTYDATTSLATKIHPISRRIDYIFALDHLQNQKFLPLECVDFRIEKQPYGLELSDHWPQIIQIRPSIHEN